MNTSAAETFTLKDKAELWTQMQTQRYTTRTQPKPQVTRIAMSGKDEQVMEHLEMKISTEAQEHMSCTPSPPRPSQCNQLKILHVSVTYGPSLGNPHTVFYQELCPND